MKENINFKERLVATNKEKIVRSLIITAVFGVVIALVFALVGKIDVAFDAAVLGAKMPVLACMTNEFYKFIFGGCVFFNYGMLSNASTQDIALQFTASPILLTGFICAVVGLILLILVGFNYKNKLLNKHSFTALTVIAIIMFLASGILFCFKDFAIQNSIRSAASVFGEDATGEIEELLKAYVFKADRTSLIFIIGQFVAATSLFAGLLVERKRPY